MWLEARCGWRCGAGGAVLGVRGWRSGDPRHTAAQAAATALARGSPRCDLDEEVRLAHAHFAGEEAEAEATSRAERSQRGGDDLRGVGGVRGEEGRGRVVVRSRGRRSHLDLDLPPDAARGGKQLARCLWRGGKQLALRGA